MIKNTTPTSAPAGRRSFIRKTGAALSAAVAAAATGFSGTGFTPGSARNDRIGRLANRVGMLEDAEKVRLLHQAYVSLLDRGLYEDVAAMFTDDAEVVYHGGIFRGREGVRRLYCSTFASGHTGRAIGPAPGFEPERDGGPDAVEVAEDRSTAIGRFAWSMQVGMPMTENSSLVAMARLQGEGIVKWWEGGTCEVSYVKADDGWKIRRLEYRVSTVADYRPGKTYALPIDVPAFTSVFPKNPAGPDRLV